MAAFWTTRIGAINQTYFVMMLFLSGQIAPLTLFPYPLQTVAAVLPFRWMISFPVELLLGRLTPVEALTGLGVQAAVGGPGVRAAASRLAGRHSRLLGRGRMNYLRLFGLYFRVGAMGEMQYRLNFFVQLFQSALQLGTAIAGLAVIFTYTHSLGGWRPEEVLALVGVYTLVGGMIGLVIYPSMEQFISSVRDGTLDFTLVKPVDAQLLMSVHCGRHLEVDRHRPGHRRAGLRADTPGRAGRTVAGGALRRRCC